MKIVLLGPPGSGKGTQAEIISDRFKLRHFDMGGTLRKEMAKGSALGNKIAHYVDQGHLVPIGIIAELIRQEFGEHPDSDLLLDGFPRSIEQVRVLDQVLQELKGKLDLVILFDITEAEVVRRISNRLLCGSCDAVYNTITDPPARELVCDKCGSSLYRREDDSEDVVRERFRVYQRETEPIITHYEGQGLLERADATLPIAAFSEKLVLLIGEKCGVKIEDRK